MAHRPKRTFRQRQAQSSDSDDAEDTSAESGAPREPAAPGREEEGPPSGGVRAEVAELPRRARGPRGRGPVWASSRRSARAGPLAESSGDQESRTVDLSTDEEDGAHHSSGSKDDQSSSSDNFNSPEEKEFSSIVKIPDAAFIQAARRKRELARAQDDYISLDVKHNSITPDMKRNSDEDPESEPDDHEKRIPFTPKPQTLRQRMTKETKSRNEETSEDSQEDENQDIWEQQQMRKAVKITEGRDIDLSHSSKSQTVKKFDTSISFPPVNLEVIKKRLNTRLTLLQDTHRAHQREYEKYIQDVKRSKSTVENLESSSSQAVNYKFYKNMKIYVENIIDCLNEKMITIQEIESSMHALLLKQAMILMKRRQDELKHESAYLQQLSRDILQDHKKVFEDVHDDFCNIQNILLKFQQWREKFPDSYYDAFIGLCIPKLLNPLIRVQLLDWNPLKLDSIGLKQMPWFTCIEEFMDNSVEDAKRDNSSDKKILYSVINKTVIPRITDFVEFIWDPSSTSQTTSLIKHCRMILEEHSSYENEVSKSQQLFRNILLWNELLSDETLQELGLGKLLNRYLIIALLNAVPGPDVVKKCNQEAEGGATPVAISGGASCPITAKVKTSRPKQEHSGTPVHALCAWT
ncbi:GC-rich sequence DNA-binding factor 2 [Sciurus carolinensis]|uniref:GC-rich sequence DNA-binding factor 2 n=1 Tax=Sciurus carolinensis TaxID=30640 RepID=A0AA41MNY7_SCICA|nr:GC-rich sequence DNA-binding factor 2 [Sciurus carolinensis]